MNKIIGNTVGTPTNPDKFKPGDNQLAQAVSEYLASNPVKPGEPGVTPHIGSNGHWYIGTTDTGIKAQGEPGVTPVKGTDYFTPADKSELVAAVIAALPDASEVSY